MSGYPAHLLGAYPWMIGAQPPAPQQPRRVSLRCFRRGGRRFGEDEFGNVFELTGDDDDGDDFGAADDDDGADDDEFGAAEADAAEADQLASELEDLAGELDDDEFGAKEDRLERRLDRLQNRLQRLRDRKSRARSNRRRQRIQRRMDKLVSEMQDIRSKLQAAKQKQRRSNRKAVAAVAAGAALAAGGGLAVAGSRQGVLNKPSSQAALLDPGNAAQLRRAQAGAGLIAQYAAPAGSGRKCKLTFYASGTTNPRNTLTVPAGLISTGTVLTTEDTPWAVLRVVGFTTSTYGTDTAAGAIALVEDLKIRGGANLFMNENPTPAADYDAQKDDFVGLRDYPTLRSPNTASVTVYATGDSENDTIILTCNLVCDVLTDDVFGAGLPGPYAG